jgi:AraC family transcriptional regulator
VEGSLNAIISLDSLSRFAPLTQASVHILYQSGFYRIVDFHCQCTDCKRSAPEYNDNFTISFVRRGNFYYHSFRRNFDAYNGIFIVDKPEFEHSVSHVHDIPDECTIIEFTKDFYSGIKELLNLESADFFSNPDIHSVALKSKPAWDHLHHAILKSVSGKDNERLQTDSLVVDLMIEIISALAEGHPLSLMQPELKKVHLATIEKAREYIAANFDRNISLEEIARYACVSVFHFSRIFKEFTTISSYRFLMQVRLKHAEMLLRNTKWPVNEVCYASGFNSVEHFTNSFTGYYATSPSRLRKAYSCI